MPLVACAWCSRPIWREPAVLAQCRASLCSKECDALHRSLHFSGENHPRFRISARLPDFSDAQKELIVGTVLGDGCLLRNSNGNAHLQCAHSVKQRAYLEYKHELLAPFSRPINVHRRLDPRYARVYETHRFHTVCHPWLTELRKEFYPTKRKVLPQSILARLTPCGLAFWLMDDGGCHGGSTLSICTVSFSPESVQMAAACLAAKWGLTAWEKKGRLNISAHSKRRLAELIGEYLPDCMLYKLGRV